MYESISNEMNNKLGMAKLQGQNQLNKTQQMMNGVSALGDAVTKGMSVYAQSTWNKDKYDLKQKLIAGQEDFLNVDNENASEDYAAWADKQMEDYVSQKSPMIRGLLNEQKQEFINDARTSFDTQLINRIDARNKLNSLETWDKAIKAFAENPDGMDLFEMKDVYKTTVGNDGIKVTHEKVKIDNLFDTESEDLTDKQKNFNKLLNVLYESQCLVSDQDTAKAYVESKIPDIENSIIQEDILSMINDWSVNGLEGSFFTEDELADAISNMYIPGGDRPYTDGEFTAAEADSIHEFIDKYVGQTYSRIYAKNNSIIISGLDGKIKEWDDLNIPITKDVLLPELRNLGMVELDENGKLVSHFGIDDKTWATIDGIMTRNEMIVKADEWASKPVDVNKNGFLDIGDVPSEIIDYIKISSGNTSAYVNEDYRFIVDFNGKTEMASSTYDEYIRQSNAQKKAEIVRDFGTDYYTFNGQYIGTEELDTIISTLGFSEDDIAGISDLRVIAKENDIAAESARIAEELNTLPEETALKRFNEYNDPKSPNYTFGVFEYVSKTDDGWVSSAQFKDLNGWKFSNSSVIEAYNKSEGKKIDEEAEKAEALQTANDLLDDFVIYRQNGANGLEIPEGNKIAEFIEEGLVQKFGADYKTNGTSRQDIDKESASLEAEIFSKFLMAMKKSGDEDFQMFAEQFEKSYGANAEETKAILDEAQRMLAKNEIAGVESYYVKFNEDMTILANFPKIDASTWPTDAAKAVLEVSNSNLETQLKMLGWEGSIDSLIPSSARAQIMKSCKELNQDYDFILRLAQNNALVQRLSNMSVLDKNGNQLNADFGKAYDDLAYDYNGMSIDKASELAKDNYNNYRNNLGESSITKGLDMKTYDQIKKDAEDGTAGQISARFNVWKPVNSVGDWRSRYIDAYKNGASLEYLKEVAKADRSLSEKDTDSVIGMVDSDFFKWVTEDESLTAYATSMAKTLPSFVAQDYFWDALVKAYVNKGENENAKQVISNATNDFMTAFGSKLPEEMYSFNENTKVYYRPELGGGQQASKETRNTIDKYESQYVAGDFDAAGINSMINDTLNSDAIRRKGGISAFINSVIGDGKDKDAIYRACVLLALETEGMGVNEYEINATDEDFWEKVEDKFPALSINNDVYDARFADHVLRVAGGWKSIMKNYTGKYTGTYGVPNTVDAEKGVFTNYDSFTQKAYDDGVYVTPSSSNGKDANYLVYKDESGIERQVNLKILDKEYNTQVAKQIQKELLEDPKFLQQYTSLYTIFPDKNAGAPLSIDDIALLYLPQSETFKQLMADIKVISTYMDVTLPIPSVSINGDAMNGVIMFGFIDGDKDAWNKFNTNLKDKNRIMREFERQTFYGDQYMSEQAQADADREQIIFNNASQAGGSILGDTDYSSRKYWNETFNGGR